MASFSNEVKNELAHLTGQNKCCGRAELFGLLKISGVLTLRGRDLGLNFTTENAALARRVLKFLKESYQLSIEVVVTRSRRLKKNNRYFLQVPPGQEVAPVLRELQLLGGTEEGSKALLANSCCRRAFLRGVFLAGGSVSKPAGDYHLEIVCENRRFAEVIQKAALDFGLPTKLTDRKNEYIVYLKEGNAITAFLSVIGAHNALLEFENVRIIKEMRNNVNRIVNCETANLNKTVQAAALQIKSIGYLAETVGLVNLPPPLKEAAELRLEHQEVSLAELAALSSDKIGKSGMNHRLKKLIKYAEDAGMKD